MSDPIRAVRWFSTTAGWYGILTLTPLLFMEAQFGAKQLPTSRPVFYFGFIAVSLSWQVAFLMLGREPLAYRVFLIPAGLEKLAFTAATLSLVYLGRAPLFVAIFGAIDLTFAAGFFLSYFKLRTMTM
jgi:hypothetical protein